MEMYLDTVEAGFEIVRGNGWATTTLNDTIVETNNSLLT
jgi:hypothetical protein